MAKPTVAHTMIANVIEVQRNKPMVSSLKIAELFERRHDSVLRAIRVELQEEISLRKLAESTYTNERGREYQGSTEQVVVPATKTDQGAILKWDIANIAGTKTITAVARNSWGESEASIPFTFTAGAPATPSGLTLSAQ